MFEVRIYLACFKKKESSLEKRNTPSSKNTKCDFNTIALQLYWNHASAWCSPVNLLHIFRIPFPKNTSEWLLLTLVMWPGTMP